MFENHVFNTVKILAAQKKVFGIVCFEYFLENIFSAAYHQFQSFQFNLLAHGRTDYFFSFRMIDGGEDENDSGEF